jgi:hypothetical protein
MAERKEDEERREFKILPLSVGIETLGGIFTPLILRGTPLPAKRYQTFSTAADNQKAVEIRIYIGERPIAQKNLEIAKLTLGGIPDAPKGEPQILLNIEVARDLSIRGEAIEQKSGERISIDADAAPIDLDEEKIKQILQEAEKNKAKDDGELRSKEQHNKAQNLIDQAENILRDKDKVKMYDSKAINQAVAELGLAMQDNNSDEIRSQSSKLENLLKSPNYFEFGDIFKNFSLFGTQAKTPPQTSKHRYQPPHKPSKQDPSQEANMDDRPSVGPVKYNIGKIFGGYNFTPDPNLCFVLMPFLGEVEPIYTDHIKPLVESEGISCQRADEMVGTNLITYDIWEKINRARFIVADLTGKNPNVFYEVGLAHALGKEVILITQSMDDVPFDLKALRCLVYSFTPRGMKELENKLVNTIRKIMSSSS